MIEPAAPDGGGRLVESFQLMNVWNAAPSPGHDLTDALTLTRQSQPVDGTATRVTARVLRWHPTGDATLLPGATYTLTLTNLTDLAGNAATATATFTHLTTTDQMLRLAYQAPTDSQSREQSDFGLTTLFQGRTWHGELGMYDYRARWYLPEAGVFGERDPEGYADSSDPYAWLIWSPLNVLDPSGRDVFVFRFSRNSWQVYATIRFLSDPREMTDAYTMELARRYVKQVMNVWAVLRPVVYSRTGQHARWDKNGYILPPKLPLFDDVVFTIQRTVRSSYQVINPRDARTNSVLYAHEFGHLLGLDDIYVDRHVWLSTTSYIIEPKPRPGFEARASKSVMGYGEEAQDEDISNVLSADWTKSPKLSKRRNAVHHIDFLRDEARALARLKEIILIRGRADLLDRITTLSKASCVEQRAKDVRQIMDDLFSGD